MTDTDKYHCMDCGLDPLAQRGHDYMVTDAVWALVTKASERRRHLCVDCIERRLGRPLEPRDLKAVPANTNIFFIARIMSANLRDRGMSTEAARDMVVNLTILEAKKIAGL